MPNLFHHLLTLLEADQLKVPKDNEERCQALKQLIQSGAVPLIVDSMYTAGAFSFGDLEQLGWAKLIRDRGVAETEVSQWRYTGPGKIKVKGHGEMTKGQVTKPAYNTSMNEESDMISGAPLDVLIRYMKKNGFKSVQLNGGSYGYTTTLEQLSKPKIRWKATDGSYVSTTLKGISQYLDSKSEWIDFCDQKKTDELEIDSLDWLLKFTKGKTPKFSDQSSWEEAGLKGDLG